MERFNSWMTHCQNRPAKSALPSHDLKWVTIAPVCITSWVFSVPQLLQCSLPPNSFHVIAFSVLVHLWVTKIKKSLWSFARVVLRDHVNRARNADHAARTCEKFVYSVVKVTRLYQPTPFFYRNSWGAQRFMGFFSWLRFSFECWLAGQAHSDNMVCKTVQNSENLERTISTFPPSSPLQILLKTQNE